MLESIKKITSKRVFKTNLHCRFLSFYDDEVQVIIKCLEDFHLIL